MYARLIRPLLFRFDAEQVHHAAFSLLKNALRFPVLQRMAALKFTVSSPGLERRVLGLTFPNPVGLAAGFDKNAELTDELACLGFGFIEIGTVTPRPQPGNERPRLFRLPADGGLINRMGFNNRGAGAAAGHLARRRNRRIIIGGNIGKNKLTPNQAADDDYLAGFETLFEQVDYFVVNVSSPNTPGLRELQEKQPLTRLLQSLQQRNAQKPRRKPILLKIAPDLTNAQLDDIVEIVLETRLDGVIATNTTLSRAGLSSPAALADQAGGVSGEPLRQRSTEVVRYLHQKGQGRFVIIGVGGIRSPQDALEKLQAGADLIQVYTGFIYEGPSQVKKICKYLIENQ